MELIAILAALGVAYVVKQQLLKRNAACAQMTTKLLNLLIGLPILLVLYAVWTFISSIGLEKSVEDLLFGSYTQWASETNYEWNVGLVNQAISSCSPDELAYYAVSSIYESVNILSVIVVAFCGALNIVKLFDLNKFPKFSLDKLFAIEMIVSLIVCLLNVIRIAIGIPVVVNRMDATNVLGGSGLLYLSLAGSVLIIVLAFVLWGQYKKVAKAYIAVAVRNQSEENTAAL